MKIGKNIIPFVILVITSLLNFEAAAVRVTANLDSTMMLMGKLNTLTLKVDLREGENGKLPMLETLQQSGIIGVCGDSVELRYPSSIDTAKNNGGISVSYFIPVQSFDSGYYHLPEFPFVTGRDTVYSNSVSLKVVPVLAEATDPINDYANIADPEGTTIFDYLPEWMIEYWWAVVIFLILLGIAISLLLIYKKRGYIIPKKPEPTPYEKAIKALNELKEENLWQQGMEKEFYTKLIDILRTYLSGRYGLNAMEMTSRQILGSLKKFDETKPHVNFFKRILSMGDFVKFAKVKPLPEDNISLMSSAIDFVESTKPVEAVDETEDVNIKNSNISANGKKIEPAKESVEKGGER